MNSISIFDPNFASNFFNAITSDFSRPTSMVMPKVDIIEKKDAYVLDMELPGFSQENVDINLNDRVLTIESNFNKSCEKTDNSVDDENVKQKDFVYLVKERRTKRFHRSFTLPQDIDGNEVSATFKNGLLTVVLPRKKECTPKQIAINVA